MRPEFIAVHVAPASMLLNRDYVQKHIFAPAGMKDTGFYALDEKVANRAIGYTLHADDHELTERRPNTSSLPGRPSSAGGAFATASDLLRFMNALQANKLNSQKWTNWILGNSFEAGGKPSLGIAGGAPGLNAAVELDNGWTVIAMSNYDPPAARTVAATAMEILTGRKREMGGPGGPVIRRRPPSTPEKTEMSAERVDADELVARVIAQVPGSEAARDPRVRVACQCRAREAGAGRDPAIGADRGDPRERRRFRRSGAPRRTPALGPA